MKIPFSAGEAMQWCGGRLRQGSEDEALQGVSIDTRSVAAGELFVAIRGEKHDAHAFLDRALAAGAAGLVVEAGAELPCDLAPELPVLEVKDTTAALGTLAAGHRSGFRGPLCRRPVSRTGATSTTSTDCPSPCSSATRSIARSWWRSG
jgi:UDP-N-acetylmuramoyl-tripeptide--D-alanyl-D-alanine ligase